jgi:hypothetical protein
LAPVLLNASVLDSRRLARLRHAVFKRLPFPTLRSDVVDVVYLTWLVDAAAARTLLPPGAPGLQLWERGGLTPFTVLTYRHGHFGPSLAGPLRRLFPSPLQSNWRLYLDVPLPETAPPRSVWFLDNLMDSALYVAGTRLFSDIMQTRLPARFTHACVDGAYVTALEPAHGGAAALSSTLAPAPQAVLPPAFAQVLGSWHEAVDMLACQDGALAWSARMDALVLARIDLPVTLDQVRPLVPAQGAAAPACSRLTQLPPVGDPLCFLVPRVPFRVLGERVLGR